MKAISIPPSLNWVGNSGPWPTFSIGIGHPAQFVEVIAATSKSNVWPVLANQCPQQVSDCELFSGGFYDSGRSDTFEPIRDETSTFELPFIPESPLGYNGTTRPGADFVGLGPSGQVTTPLRQQALTPFSNTYPFIAPGLLGLSDQPFNVTESARLFPSPLGMLNESKSIPSPFWAYNAGRRWSQPSPFYASLTFGGYDAGRGGDLKDALRVGMQTNNLRDLVVSISGFAIGNDAEYNYNLDPPTDAFIDSVVPDLWLPEAMCRVFEQAFDLQWNETAQMYLLDKEHSDRLHADPNAKVNLTLADPYDPTIKMNISLTYAAFDQTAKYPLAGIQDDSSVQYFPLKRANSTLQVYLGHTFLQEAYLAADYKRNEFYLSQARFLDDNGSPQALIIKTVYPPGHGSKLSIGAIVGIAIGAVVGILLVAGLVAWFCCRPRWKRRRNSRFRARVEAENAGLPASQLPPFQETEMQEYYAKRPLSPDSADHKQELDATTTARGSITSRAEMESPGHSSMGSPRKMGSRRTSYGFPTSPAELEGRSPRLMHSRTASGGSVEPMSPLSGVGRTGLGRTSEEVHELP